MRPFEISVNGRRPIKVGSEGVASMPPSTIISALQRTVSLHGGRPALRSHTGRTLTWSQYYAQARQFGRACVAVGMQPRDGVAIIGFNSPEWVVANVGGILAGGIAAGIYTTNTPDACAYIVRHASASIVVCEGERQLAKFLSVTPPLSEVLAYVVYELDAAPSTGSSPRRKAGGSRSDGSGSGADAEARRPLLKSSLEEARLSHIYSWEQFMALGELLGDSTGHSGNAGTPLGESPSATASPSATSSSSSSAGTGAGASGRATPVAASLDAQLDARMAAQTPESVCTLVYTSGTVGFPKAVMISHDNIAFVATSVLERFAANETERTVSFLPLSHIAAALLDIYGPAFVGFSVTFAGPDALKGSLVNSLKEVQPTIFFGVPRVFEKIQEKMLEVGARSPWCVRALSRWAKRIGTEASKADEEGRPMPWGYTAANALVFSNVKRALGLSQCRILVSAAAPLQPATLAYFASLNMPVCEVYGMSECAGPATACLPGARRAGTCGRTLPGMEIAILPIRADHVFLASSSSGSSCSAASSSVSGAASSSGSGAVSSSAASSGSVLGSATGSSACSAAAATAPAVGRGVVGAADVAVGVEPVPLAAGVEGEVCMRGRHVMVGYKDDADNSGRALDEHGWLHSGDIGTLDADGFLRITGRIKELIKTAGGENIPPVLIENTLKEELPAISQAVVVGDRRKFLTVLLALRCTVDAAGAPTEHLDGPALASLRAAGCTATTVAAAGACPAFAAYINAGIARANARAISRACALHKWRLLPQDLSVAGGELTATLKLKRGEILKMHSALVESMYAEAGAGAAE